MLKLLAALLTFGKLGKVLTTGGTMVISIFVYTMVFGFRYALGFVLLIFVHEMGHYIAARQRGLPVGAPTFVPFVGAWIQLKEMPHDVETEAFVGISGPIMGTLGALCCYWLARSQNSDLLLALAYSGFFINLFNLIPVSPFDGGRITAIVSPRVWLVGVPILVALFLWHPSPLLVLMGVLAAPQVWRAIKYDPNAAENERYYGVSVGTRIEYALWYLGLLGFLAILSYNLHGELQHLRVG